MGKSKLRSVNVYNGGHRRKVKRLNESSNVVHIVKDAVPRPKVSASWSKMELLGFQPEMMKFAENQSENEDQDRHFCLTQVSSLQTLINPLCCPNCKQPGIRLFNDLEKWMGLLCMLSFIVSCDKNLPSVINKLAYQSNKKKIFKGSQKCFTDLVSRSVEVIREKYKELGSNQDEHGILDIAVSYDGTWQKRGHTSHNGVGAIID